MADCSLDISVVTRDSGRSLPAFFDSLRGQQLPLHGVGLYLRDAGSSDATPGLLEAFARQAGGLFRHVRVDIGSDPGFGAGHNANCALAEAEFVLIATPDLCFEPATLAILLRQAQEDAPDVAAWECRQKPCEDDKDYHPATGETAWNAGACVLYRRAALRTAGGYERCLHRRGAQVELSFRLRRLGYRLRYVPRAGVWRAPAQEPASTLPTARAALAHVLLRCRYGSAREAARGFGMYLRLLSRSRCPPALRTRLAGQLPRLLWLAPRFALSRQPSGARFTFGHWTYGGSRAGAGEPQPQVPHAAPPLVSVLIRTVPGRGGCLREALASVAAQTHEAIHLVIAEDGGDSARAQAQAARASGRYREVTYLPLPKRGRCAAGNAALAAAQGELLCFLDDDDLLYADHLEILAAAMMARPGLAAACGWALEVRTRVDSREPWRYREESRQVLYQRPFDRAALWQHNYLPIQSVLFSRKLYEAHGGFDPELDLLEDWNLWVRYSLRHDFEMVPRITSLFRVPAAPDEAQRRRVSLEAWHEVARAKHAALMTAGRPSVR
ncbi:MAG TPA: glycosyltransferase [Burkholderiales bacterium]